MGSGVYRVIGDELQQGIRTVCVCVVIRRLNGSCVQTRGCSQATHDSSMYAWYPPPTRGRRLGLLDQVSSEMGLHQLGLVRRAGTHGDGHSARGLRVARVASGRR